MDEHELRRVMLATAAGYDPETFASYRRVTAGVGRAARSWRAPGRRRVRLALAVCAVAVCVGVVTLLALPGSDTPTRVGIDPAREVAAGGARTSAPGPLAFTDTNHGVGLRSLCEMPADADPACTLTLLRTTDGASTWTPAGASFRVDYPDWRGGPFIDLAMHGDDGWIYGNRSFVTHDGGHTFTEHTPGGIVAALSMQEATTWAVTRGCAPSQTCTASIHVVDNQGGSWRELPEAPHVTSPYVELERPTEQTAFISGSFGRELLVSHDDGTTWSRRALPELCGETHRISAVSATVVWAACGEASPTQQQRKQVYRSRDAGATWELVAATSDVRAPGTLASKGSVTSFLATPDALWLTFDRAPMSRSTDGGATWTTGPDLGGDGPLTFANARRGWTVIGLDVYRTVDGGDHWRRVDSL